MSELAVGPQLDAAVARRVFGMVKQYDDCWSPHSNGITLDVCLSLDPYSTDIAAAWTIIEKLRADGWLIRVQEMPDGFPFYGDRDNLEGSRIDKRVLCLIEWLPWDRNKRPGRAYADTAAVAICVAALNALEQ